ncbi:MAG: hypothetical protein O2954_08390 [bacterium]|nr:hypothetical protein [bacterium]
MNNYAPMVSGHTGFGPTTLQMLADAKEQVEEVASFQTQVRDYRAPRMEQASSIEALTLMENARKLRSQGFDATV